MATPGPALLTVMVNAAVSPALIGLLSAVLTTETSGHWTTTDAGSLPAAVVAGGDRGRVVDRAAVGGVGQAVDVDREAVAGGHRRVVADEVAADDRAGERRSVDAGRRIGRPGDAVGAGCRTTWTSVAMPSPVFVTVMSKPISSPALTGPTGLAVLTIVMFGAEDVDRAAVGVVAERARRLVRRGDRRRVRDDVAVRAARSSAVRRDRRASRPRPGRRRRTTGRPGSERCLIEQLPPSAPPTRPVVRRPAALSVRGDAVGGARAARCSTTIVNVALLAGLDRAVVGRLRDETSGQLTTTEADAWSSPSFDGRDVGVGVASPCRSRRRRSGPRCGR